MVFVDATDAAARAEPVEQQLLIARRELASQRERECDIVEQLRFAENEIRLLKRKLWCSLSLRRSVVLSFVLCVLDVRLSELSLQISDN